MKKLLIACFTLLMMFLNNGVINADNASIRSQNQPNSGNLYAFHPLNKTGFDDNSVEYKILGYQFLKDPQPSANSNARYILIKCQVNTDDLDRDEVKDAYIGNDFVKVYDNGSEATNITDVFSKKRLKKAPFNNVHESLSHIQMNRTYELDVCYVVYPYDDLELKFAPNDDESGTKIKIHQVQSSNGVTMDSQDSFANYEQEGK